MISFVVGLTNQITAPARAAQSSMINLGGAVKKTQGELSLFQKQLTLAKQVGDIEGYRKYTGLVAQHRQTLFSMNSALLAQGGAAQSAAGGQWLLNAAQAAYDALDPATLAMAVVAAYTALAGAMGFLIVKGASLAIEMVGLKNRLTATFDALGKGPDAGRKTLAFLDTLASRLPQTREQLAGWTKTYMAMGMTDLGQLRGQLVATASAQAIMGDEGAEAFQTLTKRIQEAVATSTGLKIADKQLASLASTGANVADVAAQMGLSAQVLRNQLKAGTVDAGKFGEALNAALVKKGRGPLAALGQDLPTQIAKLKENFGKLFEGVKVAPFLAELKGLFGIFDLGKASGRGMQAGITGSLNAVMKVAAAGARSLKHFLLEVEIQGLKAYIAMRPVLGVLQKFFGNTKAVKALDGAVIGLGDALGVAARGFLSVIAGGVMFADLGVRMVDGIVNGLTGGVSRVVDAAKGLGAAAMNAVKGVLGIHSPSRVMLQLGAHTGAGLAQGIRSSTATVHAASASMGVTAAIGVESGARRDAPASATGEGKRITIDVGGIHFHGGAGGKSALEITEEAVSLLFERLALAKGLG